MSISWKDVAHWGAAGALYLIGIAGASGVHIPGVSIDPATCFLAATGLVGAGLKSSVTSGKVTAIGFLALALATLALPGSADAQIATTPPLPLAAPVIPGLPAVAAADKSPCTPTSCTGLYIGAGIAGAGTNANIIGNGFSGSVFANGGIPEGDFGWIYADGKALFNVEFDAGYRIGASASVNGQTANFSGWTAQQEVDFGLSLAAFGPQQQPISLTLPYPLISPYVALGAQESQGVGTGWLTGAGAFFDVSPADFIKVGYQYTSYGNSTAAIGATPKTDQLVFFRWNHKLPF